jgi:UDP:flavonoid glycosyltransferase YjiC (YdhE family)
MRITLFTIGARGDTQPFVALAVRIEQDGHSVKLAARPDFASLAADYGVDFAPLIADQPSWARQVQALGAGLAPLTFQTLTAERLAEAMRDAVTNPAMRQRAAELGRQIQAEDGPGRTIELFLQYVDRWGHLR